jgi:23S rRNA (uracil1939-C5)-methyltransferase
VCGGCDLQDVPYPQQLAQKRDRLVGLLKGLVPADRVRPTVAATGGDAPWGLRRKVHFVFTNQRGQLALAHHARGGRSLVSVRECPVHAPEGNRLAEAMRAALDSSGVRAYPQGPLRHIVVRVLRSGAAAIVTLVLTGEGDPRVRRAVGRFLDEEPGRVSVYVNVNDEDTPYIFGRQTRHVAGPKRSVERVNGIDYRISASSFFQTNVDAAERLVEHVLDAAGPVRPDARAVDLYAGAGLFSLQLARAGFRVLAVEENPDAIDDGIASLHDNGIGPSRCRFVRSPVRRVDAWAGRLAGPLDALVLDPPRTGVGAPLLRQIFDRLAPKRVAYVSCDPDSLARDLAIVGSSSRRPAAYGIDWVQPVDMFPETNHIEAVVALTRQ